MQLFGSISGHGGFQHSLVIFWLFRHCFFFHVCGFSILSKWLIKAQLYNDVDLKSGPFRRVFDAGLKIPAPLGTLLGADWIFCQIFQWLLEVGRHFVVELEPGLNSSGPDVSAGSSPDGSKRLKPIQTTFRRRQQMKESKREREKNPQQKTFKSPKRISRCIYTSRVTWILITRRNKRSGGAKQLKCRANIAAFL